MSIRPVDLNGMIQRTQDVSTVKQQQDNKPVVEQQVILSHETKQTERRLQQVNQAQEKENDGYRYDAKEKGNGHYEGNGSKKKNAKKGQKGEKVIQKNQSFGFDIKI